MRFAYVNAFVESAATVLARVAGTPVTRGRPALAVQPRTDRGLAALINLDGGVAGQVVLDVDPDTARRLVDRMTGGADPEDDELLHDTMAELANMMIGRAVSALHDGGHRFTVSPPMVFSGGPVAFGRGAASERAPFAAGSIPAERVETLVLTLRTGVGDVVLHVSVSGD
jgi:CheY-specific phosphatase CheX